MSISWKTSITVKNMDRKLLNVVGVRTDSEDPDNLRRYSCTVKYDPANQSVARDQILINFQQQHTEAIALEGTIATLLAGWETALDNAMDSWETN